MLRPHDAAPALGAADRDMMLLPDRRSRGDALFEPFGARRAVFFPGGVDLVADPLKIDVGRRQPLTRQIAVEPLFPDHRFIAEMCDRVPVPGAVQEPARRVLGPQVDVQEITVLIVRVHLGKAPVPAHAEGHPGPAAPQLPQHRAVVPPHESGLLFRRPELFQTPAQPGIDGAEGDLVLHVHADDRPEAAAAFQEAQGVVPDAHVVPFALQPFVARLGGGLQPGGQEHADAPRLAFFQEVNDVLPGIDVYRPGAAPLGEAVPVEPEAGRVQEALRNGIVGRAGDHVGEGVDAHRVVAAPGELPKAGPHLIEPGSFTHLCGQAAAGRLF